ncbi:cytochrome c family protein [Candidatus Venteria ishoeyi]|nr:cytochrome c family protein [Candidatus Venteria ishoeyi]
MKIANSIKIILPIFFITIANVLATETISEFPTPLHVPAQTCAACHKNIYAQWKASMHSRSAPGQDPVVSAIYQEMVGSPEQEGLRLSGEYPACLKCHAPNAAKEQKTKLDQFNYAEGVNCVTCHVLERFHGMQDKQGQQLYGLDAYQVSATHLQGPSGRYLSPREDAQHPFPIKPNPGMLRTSQVCLGCHGAYKNADGVALYQTGEEYLAGGENQATCQSCHMPKTNGETNHEIMAAHNDAVLTRAIVINLSPELKQESIQLKIDLRNTMPHRFPTGSPFRQAYLKVTAYAEDGELVWSNYSNYPPDFSQSPEAVFAYQLADKNGKPVMAYQASQVQKDTRFQAFEKRQLHYSLPRDKVYLIRTELLYHMLTQDVITAHGEKFSGNLINPAVAAINEIKIAK